MENSEYYTLNLYLVCRVCLYQQEGMIDILGNEENERNSYNMFSSITNFELEKLADIPFYLCKMCLEKTGISYQFIQQAKKSHELIKSYFDNQVQEERSADKAENSNSYDKEEEQDEILDLPEKLDDESNSNRLELFPTGAINNAIDRLKENVQMECLECRFVAVNRRALSAHMTRLHREIREKWCPQCNQIYDFLDEHMKEHKNKNFVCEFCGKGFNSKGHLTGHLRSHSDTKCYKCEICKRTFSTLSVLKVHLRRHSNTRPYNCKHCEKSFVQYTSLKHHLKTHGITVEKFVCTRCCENFNTKDESEEHNCPKGEHETTKKIYVGNSTTPRNFCSECNRKVRSLWNHMKKIHGKGESMHEATNDLEPKLCNICGKQLKTNAKLNLHMRIHTGEAPHKCPYCDKRMRTRNHLVVHIRTHTGEKPHICHVCGKGFAQTSVLNTHMRLHTGRPHKCHICKQGFCRPAELKLHLRKHTGEKPYLCTECGQAFVQRSHLMEHARTHSDERPFKCKYCERGFKQNSSLKTHEQIHLGYKPYKCSQCSYSCRQSYSLTLHMKQHANDAPQPNNPYDCEMCNRSFSTQAMLNSHIGTTHSNG